MIFWKQQCFDWMINRLSLYAEETKALQKWGKRFRVDKCQLKHAIHHFEKSISGSQNVMKFDNSERRGKPMKDGRPNIFQKT